MVVLKKLKSEEEGMREVEKLRAMHGVVSLHFGAIDPLGRSYGWMEFENATRDKLFCHVGVRHFFEPFVKSGRNAPTVMQNLYAYRRRFVRDPLWVSFFCDDK